MRSSLAAALVVCLAGGARAETRTYLIAIGNNAPPVDAEGERLDPLRYADDDAADVFTFFRPQARRAWLLTVLDGDSQRRFPSLAAEAQPPTLESLDRIVAALRADVAADLRGGHEPVVLFFFSGHGTRGGLRPPSLAMLDGPLTRAVLYDHVLAALPARYLHVLVDACHAEAVVRPRDSSAEVVHLTEADVQEYAAHDTLERFPNVGAIVATSVTAESHEWTVYQRGVFSHELLSGLRGAADVNGDGVVEYSEISAFLAAANADVRDPRARLEVVVRPPAVNARAPLIDLARARGFAHLMGRTAALGPLYVEDARGNRLLDLHGERDHVVHVAVPPGEPLFIRTYARREARTTLRPGEVARLETLDLVAQPSGARGAVETSLHEGLFTTSFGPRYYKGFVGRDGLPTVELQGHDEFARTLEQRPVAAPSNRFAVGMLSGAAVLAGAGVVFGGLAIGARHDFDSTSYQRAATDARNRLVGFEAAAITSFSLAAVGASIGTWALLRRRAALRAQRATLER